MKANEAPEKIYIHSDNDVMGEVLCQKAEGDIEYVRTDAFIKKALGWIDDMIWDYLELKHPNADTYFGVDMERFKKDFKNTMKL